MRSSIEPLTFMKYFTDEVVNFWRKHSLRRPLWGVIIRLHWEICCGGSYSTITDLSMQSYKDLSKWPSKENETTTSFEIVFWPSAWLPQFDDEVSYNIPLNMVLWGRSSMESSRLWEYNFFAKFSMKGALAMRISMETAVSIRAIL